jgi:hypothetical protein
MIHLDEPDVYVDAVRRVVIAVRDGRRVQSGSDAQP